MFPAAWLGGEAQAESGPTAAPFDYVAAERMAEQTHLDARLAQLSGDMRAPRTLAGLCNPGLNLIWWLGSRGHPINPPHPHALASYFAFLFDERGNLGALQQARQSGSSVGSTTGPPGSRRGPRASRSTRPGACSGTK